mmetsp:Transcript_8080/g.16259  ORF Transcript_8080/g.16259 Transcript_8080/m.16259 type:complete len:1277 (-) Transcript_8080:118-3948(-)|eukprot:scaffold7349_cov173-Amphora_coffeaeformis.AAC.128
MDHTFGHQEIFDSLSHGSGKKSPSSSGSHRSARKSSSSSGGKSGTRVSGSQREGGQAASGASASSFVVDEAYRRQGRRLSYLAHGEMPAKPPSIIRIEPSRSTSFAYYVRPTPGTAVPSSRRSSAILRKLIFEAKQSFRKWEDTESLVNRSGTHRRRRSDDKYGSASGALSQLSLQGSNGGGGSWDNIPDGDLSSWRGMRGGRRPTSKGLLSAVLEGHSDSNTSASGPGRAHADRSNHTSPSQSISTKSTRESRTAVSSSGNGGYASVEETAAPVAVDTDSPPTRGKCLTVPSQPMSNAGLDNIDGNLIAFENDVLSIPRKSLHTFGKKEKTRKKVYTFRIQKLLGQGTFAQVFQCLNQQTGDLVAIKVVKSKPAYTRQATVEIDVFRVLQEDRKNLPGDPISEEGPPTNATDYMVNMNCYFMYQSHLCLVFQLLGLNLYEILKGRQFRGLPLAVVRSIVKQSLQGVKELSHRSIVHCDLKPENILVSSDEFVKEIVNAGNAPRKSDASKSEIDSASSASKQTNLSSSTEANPSEASRADTIQAANHDETVDHLDQGIKLIDFGSACFEGSTAHTYIQSRFYRSPEVILGLPYDSAIDMWSLGCVAAELLLGLPILPGVHEHDQLCRIEEMIGRTPDWMLEQGTKAHKYYVKFVPRPPSATTPSVDASSSSGGNISGVTPAPTPTPPLPQWRIKSLQEYVRSLSQSDIDKKGGLAKLEKPPGNRYFRKKSLSEIMTLHSSNVPQQDKTMLIAFLHFLYGLLDPDPWKRWTAFQAVQHPFITGQLSQLKKKTGDVRLDPKETNLANLTLEYYWKAPWDPAICRRKLLNVQKMREKQQANRRSLSSRSPTSDISRKTRQTEPSSTTSQSSRWKPVSSNSSPPGELGVSRGEKVVDTTPPFATASSVSSIGMGGERTSLARRTGPQSFKSGLIDSGHQFVDADFAYALQRPGVVPASSAHGSYSSQNASPSVHIPDFLSHGPTGTSYPHQGHMSSHSFGHHDRQFVPGTPEGYASASHIARDPGSINRSSHYGASSVASSAASSVTTDTRPFDGGYFAAQGHRSQNMSYMDPQQAMLQQQQQFATMQQQQGSSQSQFGMPQGGQMEMQQQAPVVTQVQAPGGGYYFVMTSPTGQTMLLQPVAAMGQTQQQMPMFGTVQNQQHQAQFMPQQNMQFPQHAQIQQAQMQPVPMGAATHSQMQGGQMGVPQGQMFQAGMQQQQQQFYQPQMMQQRQFQQQQQFYQPQIPQQYDSSDGHSASQASRSSYQESHNPGGQCRYPNR